jgi:hypothetical protein
LGRRFLDTFVDELAKLSATALVSLVGFLVIASGSVLKFVSGWISIAIAVVLLAIGGLIARLFLTRLFVVYPRRRASHEVLTKHFIYKLEYEGDRRLVICRRFYKVMFLQDGIDTLREFYFWTGTDPSPPRVIGGTCEVSEPYNDTIWTVVDLRLQRAFNKGETYEYELEWNLDDTDRQSRPFFSAPTNEPTRHLKFSLYLPETPLVEDVVVEQRRSIDSLVPFHSEQLPIRDGHAAWEKTNPGRYFYYCLHWRYADDT